MNTLNSDIQDIIYKFKHNLEYRQVLNEFNDMWSFFNYELGYTNLNNYEDGAICDKDALLCVFGLPHPILTPFYLVVIPLLIINVF